MSSTTLDRAEKLGSYQSKVEDTLRRLETERGIERLWARDGTQNSDYIASLAYIEETASHDEMLEAIRLALSDRTHHATTTSYDRTTRDASASRRRY